MSEDSKPTRIARKKVTIVDVAAAANVSTATVSLVMQNKGQLSQETRDRVIEAASTVGYIRREPQKARRKRPASYWFVVDDIGNPYFHEIYRGIYENLDSRDCVVNMMCSDDLLERQAQILDHLTLLRVSGLILVPASGTRIEHLAEIADARIPFILAVRNIGAGHFDYIGGNPMMGMSMAAEHLVQLGHRRIAFVGGYPANYAYHERYAGLVSTLSQHGLAISEKHIASGGSNKHFARKATTALLALDEPPTAFIGYNDLVAIGIMGAVADHGLVVGRDVAVVGYDDIPESSEQAVPLTTVATPARSLGKMIANALRRIVSDPEHAPINVTQPPSLVIRQSCGSTGTEQANDISRAR